MFLNIDVDTKAGVLILVAGGLVATAIVAPDALSNAIQAGADMLTGVLG